MHLFWCSSSAGLFLSTPSARRATNSRYTRNQGRRISIHALREEGDARLQSRCTYSGLFLSTPSARRATIKPPCICIAHINFYPRPPRGGRPDSRRCPWGASDFYPRPPRGGRQLSTFLLSYQFLISIHALREEGDQVQGHDRRPHEAFLSTPSARRATFRKAIFEKFRVFLSTPSARRATRTAIMVRATILISIHALREEGDFATTQLEYNPI